MFAQFSGQTIFLLSRHTSNGEAVHCCRYSNWYAYSYCNTYKSVTLHSVHTRRHLLLKFTVPLKKVQKDAGENIKKNAKNVLLLVNEQTEWVFEPSLYFPLLSCNICFTLPPKAFLLCGFTAFSYYFLLFSVLPRVTPIESVPRLRSGRAIFSLVVEPLLHLWACNRLPFWAVIYLPFFPSDSPIAMYFSITFI
jgi:hypothetical protein